jgi:sialic acid synthase SpsE
MTDLHHCQFIVALDANHNGDIAIAKALVEAASECGSYAVKVTQRHVSECYQKDTYHAPYHAFPELGDTFGEVMEALELSPQHMAELRAYSQGRINFIAAPYDIKSFREMADLDPDGYQVDPPVVPHISLLEAIAAENKPVWAAVGMCSDTEIEALVDRLGMCDLTLLHCVAAFPLGLAQTSLGTMPYLRQQYGKPVGYLSYDEDLAGPVAALALGATTIQKPFTLDRHLRGPYHHLSCDKEQWKKMTSQLQELETSLVPVEGRMVFDLELDALNSSRVSMVASQDLEAGTNITAEMINFKAPFRGLSPVLLTKILGKKLIYNLQVDEPITFGMIEP